MTEDSGSPEAAGANPRPDPAPIVQYWHEEEVPADIEEIAATFRERNPGMRHLVFSERTAAEFIAERYGEREAEAFAACAVPAMQADYFRYCAVLAMGGVYSDLDMRCVGSLGRLTPAAGAGRLFERPSEPDSGLVVNGLFAFGSAGHPFLELALEIATANIESRLCDRVYYTTGPPIFSCLCLLRRLGSFDALAKRFGEAKGRALLAESFARYCEAIGDIDRVAVALEGIEVLPASVYQSLVGPPERPLAYKESETHWTNLDQEIFRGARRAPSAGRSPASE